MAKIWYTKDAQYTLPAWNPMYFEMDGIYIDSSLFENGTPVLDNILWISVQPDKGHLVNHSITLSIPSFASGQVTMLSKMFTWLPGQGNAQSDKIFCNGQPYGMGLNIISVLCAIILGGVNYIPIIYDVGLIMEVNI
jgi:hypothetical protein